jgi:membrane-associated phospholipid phosphatase
VTQNRRILWWVGACLIGILVLVAAFWLDPVVRSWMVEHRNRELRVFMAAVSRYGDWPSHVILGFLLLGLAWWRGQKKWARVFLAMLVACALAGVAARVIKISAGRARPSVQSEMAWRGPQLSSKFHSFPSGHTASSTAFFAVLLFVRWRVGLACLVIPTLIAFSRMYVAAHYLSDVAAAGILGLLCAWIVVRVMNPTGEYPFSTLNAQRPTLNA